MNIKAKITFVYTVFNYYYIGKNVKIIVFISFYCCLCTCFATVFTLLIKPRFGIETSFASVLTNKIQPPVAFLSQQLHF